MSADSGLARLDLVTVRSRPCLVDAPLGFVVALLALGIARVEASIVRGGTPPMRPPWMQPEFQQHQHPHFGFAQPGALHEPYTWAALVWVIILGLGIAVRRIRPLTGYSITVIGATGYLAAGLPFGPVLLAPALGLLALATRMPARGWAPWSALLLPLIWAGFIQGDYLGLADPNFYTAIILGPPLIMVPALIATIRRVRTEENRKAHDLELRRAAYQERLRIARDVHDLIGHSLSVINMQAGVALYLLDKDQMASEPEPDHRVGDSLQAIRTTSKNALDELRATLAVFRGEVSDDQSVDGRAPVSGLARLPELVDTFRAAGRTVTVRTEGELDGLPGPVDNAAYRVLQEALTNVARHAAGAAAHVMIIRSADRLIVQVTDDGPGPSRTGAAVDQQQTRGSGLIGMSERARAVGGDVVTGPGRSGGFIVRAEFPLRRPEASL